MPLLLARTHYSLLTAPASPRVLCEAAVLAGCAHLVLADGNGLYGLWDFARQAGRVGLHAVFGAELVHRGRRLFALARDRTGYQSLCRLLTDLHLRADFDLLRAVARGADGLWLLCADLRLLPGLSAHVDRDRLGVLLPPRGVRPTTDERAAEAAAPEGRKLPDPGPWWPRHELVQAARDLELPLVAAREVWFPRREDHALHRLFLAVKHNRALHLDCAGGAGGTDCGDRGAAAQPGMHLPVRGRWAIGFEDFPAAVARAEAWLAECTLSFPQRSAPVFPAYAVPDGETPEGHLRRQCETGLRRRYGGAPGEQVTARLRRELQVIEAMGFAPYFLVVREIAGLAEERGIPCLGRGSAADSLVAYCLGLTDADPVRYGLLFERFLNPGRNDLPDIDLDFCWRRRDELIDAVYAHFGRQRVAMIATYNTCGPRAAYQEAAKAAGMPPEAAAARTRRLPWHAHPGVDLVELAASTPGFFTGSGLSPERERLILACAQGLLQAPRHLGVHPGGVVITPGAIAAFAPLERAHKGVVITQFDMHAVEGVGLVKIDLLGNRALTIVQDCVLSLGAVGIAPPDLQQVAEDDGPTTALLQEGRTLGCFQVESPAMRTLLRQVQCKNMDRVIQAIALVRPGPAATGMKDAFIRRARGLEEPTAAHPLLAEVFADTFGIMLYQEDVIRAAMAVAGMDGAEGDRLRRQLGKRGASAGEADAFLVAGLKRGLPRAAVEQVWREMARFAGYSFCKAHAVSYGRLAFRCVYLKARWPGPFLAAVLQNDAGYFDKGVYVEDLKRNGVQLLPPCVNAGSAAFEVLAERTVRVGLAEVRGMSQRTLQAIADARRLGGPFRSVEDFLDRVEPQRDEAENLVLAGALDSVGGTRPELLWRLRVAAVQRARGERAAAVALGVLLPEAVAPKEVSFPSLPDYDLEERTRIELEVFGYALGAHPVEVLWRRRDLPAAKAAVPCGALLEMVGRQVLVFGWAVAYRGHRGGGLQPMCFVTLEDGTGIVEATVFPKVYARVAADLHGRGPFLVRGVVEERLGGVGLRVTGVRAVAE